MTALVRYTLSTVVASQRYLPPLLLFLAVLAVFTAADDGPLTPVYAISGAAVFVCGTWLTIAVVNAEDPVQRSITVVNAGGSGRVLVASVWVAFGWCVLLAAAGLLYPLATGHHQVTPAVLALGAAGELTGACTGIAVGLLCSRLVIRRTGWSALAAVAAIMVFLLVPHVPPVHPVFRLLAGDHAPAALLLPVFGLGIVSVALVAGATVLTRVVALRRD
jgi:hypothetical protein